MLFIFCYVLPFEHGFCCLSHGQLAFHDDLLVDDLDEIVTNIILLEDFDEVLELDVIAVGVLVWLLLLGIDSPGNILLRSNILHYLPGKAGILRQTDLYKCLHEFIGTEWSFAVAIPNQKQLLSNLKLFLLCCLFWWFLCFDRFVEAVMHILLGKQINFSHLLQLLWRDGCPFLEPFLLPLSRQVFDGATLGKIITKLSARAYWIVSALLPLVQLNLLFSDSFVEQPPLCVEYDFLLWSRWDHSGPIFIWCLVHGAERFAQIDDVIGLEVVDLFGLIWGCSTSLSLAVALVHILDPATVRQLLRLLLFIVIELHTVLQGIVFGDECFVFNLTGVLHHFTSYTSQVVLRGARLNAQPPLLNWVLLMNGWKSKSSSSIWVLLRLDAWAHLLQRLFKMT